jgi:hypothetical protein
MGKCFFLLSMCGVSMIVAGILAGIILYVNETLDYEMSLIILSLILVGIAISLIGLKLLDWRKTNGESNSQKKKKDGK